MPPLLDMIRVYTQQSQGADWLDRFRGRSPLFVTVLGFTATGLIPGISAAGATPSDRQLTAVADAEFLYNGAQPQPRYPLPPLQAGASPVLITRAVTAGQQIPVYLFNAGLLHPPSVPCIELGGVPARCLSQGNAIDGAIVRHLFQQGWLWGEKLAAQVADGYVVLSECVVGGTTTALAVLTALGWNAQGKVNSSHPTCNHQQKWDVVQAGLRSAFGAASSERWLDVSRKSPSPWQTIAAVGDPMQIVVAGMAMAASRSVGVLLAGGTQMLAVYALMQSLAEAGLEAVDLESGDRAWRADHVVVGTTRWVAADPTGDTIGLAAMLQVPLLATQLSFAGSRWPQLRAYEQGFVKEGVGAGASAIVARLYQGWGQEELLQAIEQVLADLQAVQTKT